MRKGENQMEDVYYYIQDSQIHRVTIYDDPYPENPLTVNTHAGHVMIYHDRYALGDNKGRGNLDDMLDGLMDKYLPDTDYEDMLESDKARALRKAGFAILPIDIMDHSLIGCYCSDIIDDSYHAGYAYMTPEEMAAEQFTVENANSYLKGVIKEYSLYLEGFVYGYTDEAFDGNGWIEQDTLWEFISDKQGDDLLVEMGFSRDSIVSEAEALKCIEAFVYAMRTKQCACYI